MKKIITLLLVVSVLTIGWKIIPGKDVVVDKEEAKKAFSSLNTIRQNPSAYSNELGVNLKNVKSRAVLKWNDTLAKVAEQKAFDKLKEEWIKNKKENYFESIQAGAAEGSEAIKLLIIDSYDKNLGHRKHLLGMDEWNAGLKDIGIGFVKCSDCPYKTYISIVIAKHNW